MRPTLRKPASKRWRGRCAWPSNPMNERGGPSLPPRERYEDLDRAPAPEYRAGAGGGRVLLGRRAVRPDLAVRPSRLDRRRAGAVRRGDAGGGRRRGGACGAGGFAGLAAGPVRPGSAPLVAVAARFRLRPRGGGPLRRWRHRAPAGRAAGTGTGRHGVRIAVIDYGSGNLASASRALALAA